MMTFFCLLFYNENSTIVPTGGCVGFSKEEEKALKFFDFCFQVKFSKHSVDVVATTTTAAKRHKKRKETSTFGATQYNL
jgi:hypothetical protein